MALASVIFIFVHFLIRPSAPYVDSDNIISKAISGGIGEAVERRRRFESDFYSVGAVRQVQCYSCMSHRLKDNWGDIWQMFRRPEHFSESCDTDHFSGRIVKIRNCTDFCILLISETKIFGQKIPVNTRGCMSDVLNYRRDAVPKLRNGNVCVRRHLSELFNDGGRKFLLNEIVTLCACHSNYCNGACQSAVRQILRFLPLLIACGFWRCFA